MCHFVTQVPLTPSNYDSLVSMAATEITTQLETSVMKASFNRVSFAVNRQALPLVAGGFGVLAILIAQRNFNG